MRATATTAAAPETLRSEMQLARMRSETDDFQIVNAPMACMSGLSRSVTGWCSILAISKPSTGI